MDSKVFIKNDGSQCDNSSLKNAKVVLMYFSASWCPPCHKFTPLLAKFYNEVNKNGKKLEVIFVSLCKTEDKFKEYFKSMPWISLPYNPKLANDLGQKYGIRGIPALLVMNEDGTVADPNGRDAITGGTPDDAMKKWMKMAHKAFSG